MQESKNLKKNAIEQEKTWGRKDWSLVLSCHLLQLQRFLTLSLSFSGSRRKKWKLHKRLKKPRETLIISLNKNAILSSLVYRGPRGLFIAFRRRGHPTTAVRSIAWSTANGLPRILGQSRVSTAESWPLRQRILCHSIMPRVPSWSSRRWRICFGSVQIWASLLWASKFLFNSFKNHKNWAFFSI